MTKPLVISLIISGLWGWVVFLEEQAWGLLAGEGMLVALLGGAVAGVIVSTAFCRGKN